MGHEHRYEITTEWTGDRGTGTTSYRDYGRDHIISAEGKPPILGSADRTFHGDRDRWNPEELLLAALSQCHMLSYLHVATTHGVVVVGYEDAASGTLQTETDGSGHFTRATLRPRVTVAAGSMRDAAQALHEEAATKCFIAASVNFPVEHEPVTLVLA
ncbi:OsmC family protein [Microbacterium sp. STN6]|uniref:OsmC family protein n=1 Tax=Microbacterium sp. STN6 TaxID=2995588 RepID=UPI0022609CA7|nr:OsmC family protein [Microbacterium sp. STN6]MCX7521200.1 OsmC family protein [Microbacterium sp. STN6]